ncbi:MAG TPA: rhomboid family intramembrane serine protease, partial [Burkholderiales bacterium]|nr:rhomboid family intramembrane serine protease [Burkholderiales bacterium]
MFIPLHDENPTLRFPAVTVVLVAVNIAVFTLGAFSPQGIQQSVQTFGAVPYAVTHFLSVTLPGAGVPPLLTLLTSLFIHGSLLHVLGNMLYLWIFGNNIEDVLGPFRFILFYFACGLAASLTQIVATPSSRVPMVGASGAIAGVLGAYWVLFPRARVETLIFVFVVPVPAGVVLGLWFI